jgi:hypothetical protein
MNLLFIGDIFASPGRRAVAEHLSAIITAERIDLAVANAENAAGGFGITPIIAEELFALGLDVLTSGNHIWDKRETADYLDRQPRLLRPANYPGSAPGRGVHVGRARNGVQVAVINLQGRTHMLPIDDPFRKADEILNALEPGWQGFRGSGHAYARADGRYVHSAGRHGVPDGRGHDRALRLGDRGREGHHPAAVPDRDSGPHGGGPG